VANIERGTKRQCLECGTKFYDLNKDPIVCPHCGTTFVPASLKPAPRKAAEPVATEEVETDVAAVAAGAEVISLEDAEDDIDVDDDAEDDIPDVEDIEVDDELGGDDDDVFLEEEDDDDKLDFDVKSDGDEH